MKTVSELSKLVHVIALMLVVACLPLSATAQQTTTDDKAPHIPSFDESNEAVPRTDRQTAVRSFAPEIPRSRQRPRLSRGGTARDTFVHAAVRVRKERMLSQMNS